MPGDALLPDALGQLTDGITIHATPEAIWPWLVQMGSDRAGFYSVDLLDNANRRSAREIHPELQAIAVGDVLPARPGHVEGFEVLLVDEPRALVLGGLYDGERVAFTRRGDGYATEVRIGGVVFPRRPIGLGHFPRHLRGIRGNAAVDLGLVQFQDLRAPPRGPRARIRDAPAVGSDKGIGQRIRSDLRLVVVHGDSRHYGRWCGFLLTIQNSPRKRDQP